MYAAALKKTPGVDGGPDVYGPEIRVSDDEGEHWTEHPYMLKDRASFELEAVDPLDPDTIVASVRRPDSIDIPPEAVEGSKCW